MAESFSKVKSQTEGKKLIIERRFDAPKDVVFRAFSDSKELESWWGPEGWQTENRLFEFEPGGVWLYCMRCIDPEQGDFYGQEAWGKSVYHEIHPPNVIIYTDVFADENGNTAEGMPASLSTVEFAELDGQTDIIITSQFQTEEDMRTVIEMGVIEGVSSQFNRLDGLLKEKV